MEICSIGASGISARDFFVRLKEHEITSIIDTRVHASSQLAGFTRKESLSYFSETILKIEYIHELQLAPEASMLKAYRNKSITWDDYQDSYLKLLIARGVPGSIDIDRWGHRPALLCSESDAAFCHRRLAAEFISQSLGAQISEIRHL